MKKKVFLFVWIFALFQHCSGSRGRPGGKKPPPFPGGDTPEAPRQTEKRGPETIFLVG